MSKDSTQTNEQWEKQMMTAFGLSRNQVRQRLGTGFPVNEGGRGRAPRSIGVETSTPPTTRTPEVKITVQAFPPRTVAAVGTQGGAASPFPPSLGELVEVVGYDTSDSTLYYYKFASDGSKTPV